MLDYRITTFLTLCDEMNYRKTAQLLNMTQPAVTQHIHYLEQQYGQKLFSYTGRRLEQTTAGHLLEQASRTARYNDLHLRQAICQPQRQALRIGATKTIGDYVIAPAISKLIQRGDIAVSLLVDNTQTLLHKLTHTELDIALIEGYFDKQTYGYHLMRQERLVGICGKSHPFAGKTIPIERLSLQLLILREEGSGTRAVFEQALQAHSLSLDFFPQTACISSFEVIKQLVSAGHGIAFVYESVVNSDPSLASFQTEFTHTPHEFNFVYLKNTQGKTLCHLLENT